jgi:ribosomal protein L12E/L44/L45/RPP1/RPP2
MGRRDAASQQSRGWRGLPVLAVAAAFCLSGCASISQKFADTASQLPEVGLSANAPARPVQQMAYPAVHDVPPPRTATMLTDMEQQRLETDLVSARDQQQTAAPVGGSKKAKAVKDQAGKDQAAQAAKDQSNKDQSSRPAPISASSSRTIY